jgi:dUTP pyrophosphatase
MNTSRYFPLEMKKVNSMARSLRRGTDGSAGFDVAYCGDTSISLYPRQTIKLPTGWAFAIPNGVCMQVLPRSGTAIKKGLRPINTPGLIDPDYRGELFVALENASPDGSGPQHINPGDFIAQLLFVPYCNPRFQMVDELGETARGEGGFGSTGDR